MAQTPYDLYFECMFLPERVTMNILDMRTIFLGHTVSSLLITMVMLWVWIQNRKRFKGITLWLASFVLQTAGIILILMRGVIFDYVSIVISNMLIVTGAVSLLFGLISFTEIKFIKFQNYLLIVIFFVAYTFLTLMKPSLALRNILFSSAIVFISVQCSWLLLQKAIEGTRENYRGTGLVFVLYAILYLVRIVTNIRYPQVSSLFSSVLIDAVLIIISQMLGITLTFSLVMMINGRLFYDLNLYSEEREKMVGELRRLATTDNLTGIHNRMKLELLLTAEVLRSRRYNRPLSVILIDVDKFKSVNDTYGHLAGDTVLKDIARLLKENIRESDYVGRWGGEEFLVINPETSAHGASSLAEKLRKNIEEHKFQIVGAKTISLGVATLQGEEWEEDMLKRADQALYRAKNGGRNRVEM